MATTFRDVNTQEFFPMEYLDVFGRPKPQHFGAVRYHSWGPIVTPAVALAPQQVQQNALQNIPKDKVLGTFAKTDSRIANGLHRIRESLQRLSYPTGFSRNDGISVERALELRFRQIYGPQEYAEEQDPFVWQVYTWTTAEILNRLLYLKLQVDDLFGTPAVVTAGVPKTNAIGDPDYYSGVDRVTPNLVRPINTRDTWTQASIGEYDPLHNYGIRRLIAEGKGCVGYRYSCCYQSMGSEGCIIGYPEKERGSIPQLYTWFGGFPPSETTKQYRGLVFQGNEAKCQQIHNKITTRLTTELVGKIAAGKFEKLTAKECESVYRIAELIHEYNENIAPGSKPNLPKSKALKDIVEYLRQVIRLEKTTEEVRKETELEENERNLKRELKNIVPTRLLYDKNLLVLLKEFPFNDNRVQKLTRLLEDIRKTIILSVQILREESVWPFFRDHNFELSNAQEWLEEIDYLEESWRSFKSELEIDIETEKNYFTTLLKKDPFVYSEYQKEVLARVPEKGPAQDYLLELGRLHAEDPAAHILFEANKTRNLEAIRKGDVEALQRKRGEIRYKELEAVTNKFRAAFNSWQLGDRTQKETVTKTFEQLHQHINLSNNKEWIDFINNNRASIIRWIQSVASASSIAKVKVFLEQIASTTLQLAQGKPSNVELTVLQKQLNDRIDRLNLDIKQGIQFENDVGTKLIRLKSQVPAGDPTGADFYTSLNKFRIETKGKDQSKEDALQKFADYILFNRPETLLNNGVLMPQEYATRYSFGNMEQNEVIKTMDQLKSFNQKKIAYYHSRRDDLVESATNRAVYYPNTSVWVDIYKLQIGGYVDALRDFLDSEKTSFDIDNILAEIKKQTEIKLGTIK